MKKLQKFRYTQHAAPDKFYAGMSLGCISRVFPKEARNQII